MKRDRRIWQQNGLGKCRNGHDDLQGEGNSWGEIKIVRGGEKENDRG